MHIKNDNLGALHLVIDALTMLWLTPYSNNCY